MEKIAYISGTRADYSLMRKSLIMLDRQADLTVIATCMHLSKKFGLTVEQIKNDGLRIKEAKMLSSGNDLGSMVLSFGKAINGIYRIVEEISPSAIFVEGDRGESLAGAIIGAHLNIPVVHHGGGDLSKSIDNKIRYAITMFSDCHLTGNMESYWRLVKAGIPKKRIFNVGEPGLDDIRDKDFTSPDDIFKKYEINPAEPLILFIQHPNTEEYKETGKQIKESLDAIEELGIQTIAVFSNSDAGGGLINKALSAYAKKIEFLKVYLNIERKDFLGLMNICEAMVGNSTAGIVELPSFGKPFVCIGTRQASRLKTANIIETGYNKEEICHGILRAINDKKLKKKLKAMSNPYGDGKSSRRIADIILNLLKDENTYNKR